MILHQSLHRKPKLKVQPRAKKANKAAAAISSKLKKNHPGTCCKLQVAEVLFFELKKHRSNSALSLLRTFPPLPRDAIFVALTSI
jgi:hypothetical protein